VGSERIGEAELPHEGLLTVGAVTFRALYDASAPVSMDEATHHDLGSETKSDVEVDQSVKIVENVGPMEPMEIDGFERFKVDHNDLTQPASPKVDADEATVEGVDVTLPPVVGESPDHAARKD